MPVPSVALVGYPGFDPFLFSIPYVVFSTPMPTPLFALTMVTPDGTPLTSKAAFTLLPGGDLSVLENMDVIIIPGWHSPEEPPEPALAAALVRAHERGAWIVGLCYAAYVLAYAGLLEGRKASTHWQAEGDFRRRFPGVRLNTNSLYVDDDRVVTSAGAGAGVDCCLFLVRKFYGLKIANRIARVLVMPPYRDGGQAQFIELPPVAASEEGQIGRVLDYLQQHLQEAHRVDSLAQRASMSRRTFTRHFQKITGMAPGKWLMNQRLRRACELLESTSLSMEQIAEQTGYHASNLFRHHFRMCYQVSPRTWRKNFNSRELEA